MQQTTLQYLADIVATQGIAVFPCRIEKLNSRHFKKMQEASEIEDIYKQLGGRGQCWNIEFPLPEGIETEQVRLSLDGPLQFNRYRAATLNSPIYDKQMPGWLETYRRNCRSQERECLKDGVREGVWTNREAEFYFGEAQQAGDFFGPGAPAWKLEAFRQFLADIYLFRSPQRHIRLSLYERLMIQGKLVALQQLLLSRSETNQHYLIRYLSRQLQIPAPNPASGKEI